ncbi:YopJ family acetyltransferase [Rhizobacter sp. Root1221]|uniref:YopJ family acetyltransferase n=1 Tax=Rhizobacter sp. Root1221 TaxID=1736433 RepID=UPI0006FA69D3|nr:YopJ family acetyltransferase [Rhizobacter sp. Root1221]KQV78313.1 hypothetical protein ASC87_12000 [Rhizobacter sp. Root1221]
MGLRSLDRRSDLPVPTRAPRAELTRLQALAPLTEVARLPAEPSAGVVSAPSASTARQKISAYVDELRTHLKNHTEPEPRDHLFLDVLASSENIRTPGLNLRILRSAKSALHAVARALADAPPPGAAPGALQWQAVFDDGGHRVAASVRIDRDDPGRASVILIDSRLKGAKDHHGHAENIHDPALPTLSQTLDSKGLKLQVTYMSTDAQRNLGCTIFALSAVKKMHDSAAIDQMHSDALAAAAERPDTPSIHEEDARASEKLEAGFFKHVTSSSVIDRYLHQLPEDKAAEPVNKREEGLRDRFERNVVFRAKDHKLHVYSSSIESKRIAFFEAALALPGLGLDQPWREPPQELDFAVMLQALRGRPPAPTQAQAAGAVSRQHEGGGPDMHGLLADLLNLPLETDSQAREQALQTLRDASPALDELTTNGGNTLHLLGEVLGGVSLDADGRLKDRVVALVSLLVEAGVDVNGRDDYERTPLFDAAKSEHLWLVKALLDNGADVNAEADEGTPMFAVKHLAVLDELIRRGADIHQLNEDGLTPAAYFENEGGEHGNRLAQALRAHAAASPPPAP